MSKSWGVTRITITQRDLLISRLTTLVEALGYKSAMERAGVPEKRIKKIMKWWGPGHGFRKACRQELRDLIADVKERFLNV